MYVLNISVDIYMSIWHNLLLFLFMGQTGEKRKSSILNKLYPFLFLPPQNDMLITKLFLREKKEKKLPRKKGNPKFLKHCRSGKLFFILFVENIYIFKSNINVSILNKQKHGKDNNRLSLSWGGKACEE